MQKSKNNKNKNKNKNKKDLKGRLSKAPVAMAKEISSQAAKFRTERGVTIVAHREFIQDILGSVNYTIENSGINPGDSDTFPWLSSVALNFESYKIRSLRYYYEPMAPTTTTGSVMLYIDYDCEDDSPNTKGEFLAQYGAVRSAPWTSTSLLFDTKRLAYKNYFIRGHIYPPDRKQYDLGSIMIGCEGQASNAPIGELWVEYEVELIHPQVSQLNNAASRMVSDGANIGMANPWGDTPSIKGSLPVERAATNLFQMRFLEPGDYFVLVGLTGTVALNPAQHIIATDVEVPSVITLSTWAGAVTNLVWLAVPVQVKKRGAIFGINTGACMLGLSQVFFMTTRGNYSTMSGFSIDPY